MSKGLAAFKRVRNNLQWIKENVANLKMYFENEDLHFKEDLDIIETALKDYESMKQTKIIVAHTHWSADDIEKLKNQRMFVGDLEPCEIKPLFDEETQKKLKALEILKKLIFQFGGIDELLGKTDNDYVFLNMRITKSTYDLLKEVLS